MPFFHAEHLFEQKHAVLEPKQHLLEAEKLHTVTINVHFSNQTHTHPTTDMLRKAAFALLFHKKFL